jgi:Spy/CpxP family protein refolding chaperone
MLSLAAALAACASNSRNTDSIQPGGSASRSEGGRRGGGGRADEQLLRNISLSDDQRQRIDAIRSRYRAQMEQSRQQSGGDRSAMREAMQQEQTEIRNVLTPDQQRQFDQNVADMRNRMQQGGGRGGPPQE